MKFPTDLCESNVNFCLKIISLRRILMLMEVKGIIKYVYISVSLPFSRLHGTLSTEPFKFLSRNHKNDKFTFIKFSLDFLLMLLLTVSVVPRH